MHIFLLSYFHCINNLIRSSLCEVFDTIDLSKNVIINYQRGFNHQTGVKIICFKEVL